MRSGIPALGVAVHVLVVVVQAGDVAEGLDPPHRRGQALVAAALGIGRQVVGMPAVVAALGPAADDEQAAAKCRGPFAGVRRRAAASSNVQWTRTDSSLVLSSFIRRARQVQSFTFAAPDEQLRVRIAADLLPQRHGQPLLLGHSPIAGGHRVPVAAGPPASDGATGPIAAGPA